MPRAPAPRDPPPSSPLARSALDKLPIAPSPYPRHRARNNYDLSTNSAASDDLGLPAVTAAAVAVATWADDHSSLPRGFFRDATIRMSTAGALHVKLVLQCDSRRWSGPYSGTHGASFGGRAEERASWYEMPTSDGSALQRYSTKAARSMRHAKQ